MPLNNEKTLADFAPTITYDIRLGSMVDYVDADPDYFAHLTRTHVSSRKIRKSPPHHIHFSPDNMPGIECGITKMAQHDSVTNETTVFLGSLLHHLEVRKRDERPTDPLHDPEEDRRQASRIASEFTIHETRHAIDTMKHGQRVFDREVENYRDQHASISFGAKLLLKGLRVAGQHGDYPRTLLEGNLYHQGSRYDEYLEEPWEKRARETATQEIQLCDERGSYPVEVVFKHNSGSDGAVT